MNTNGTNAAKWGEEAKQEEAELAKWDAIRKVALNMMRAHISTGKDQGYSAESVEENLMDTLVDEGYGKNPDQLDYMVRVIQHHFTTAWNA